jgi:S-DNA-T family DNA segregation ATPase FtsK/SpoIIIE
VLDKENLWSKCRSYFVAYKKHPAEVKFVLVDPKSRTDSFNKIERHYLAKLPDTEDILTDNAKVVNTLNSLVWKWTIVIRFEEMVRNIKEYNDKFKARKLNPENGHRFYRTLS